MTDGLGPQSFIFPPQQPRHHHTETMVSNKNNSHKRKHKRRWFPSANRDATVATPEISSVSGGRGAAITAVVTQQSQAPNPDDSAAASSLLSLSASPAIPHRPPSHTPAADPPLTMMRHVIQHAAGGGETPSRLSQEAVSRPAEPVASNQPTTQQESLFPLRYRLSPSATRAHYCGTQVSPTGTQYRNSSFHRHSQSRFVGVCHYL